MTSLLHRYVLTLSLLRNLIALSHKSWIKV